MFGQVFSAAREVDFAFLYILAFAIGILLLVTGLMLYFMWRYHYTRNPEPADIKGNLVLELLWTIIPTIIVMSMFWFGWTSFKAMRTVPEGALVVGVEARMWSWSFSYEGGKRSPVLMAPVHTDVKLSMTSRDVIHSFYVPAMRIKMDTVPGLTTTAWFNSDTTGEFDILCAEYCGLKHANMIATLKIVPQEEFQEWLAGEDAGSRKAQALFENYGCTSCHSLDGTDGVGPSLAGLGGRMVAVTDASGAEKTVSSDEGYLRRAVLDPGAEVVKGYAPSMPPFEGVVTDEDLTAMVNWMLHGDVAGPERGRLLAEAEGCLSCHSTDGSVVAGPSFKDLYGAERSVTDESGAQRTVTADEDYLRESILKPGALVVSGQDPIMPAYDYLEPAQVDELLDFIESLSASGAQAGAGEAPSGGDGMADLQAEGCLSCHSTDGTDSVGPTFQGLFGSAREVEDASGAERTVTADEAYLRASITHPHELITKGFGPMMPEYDALPADELERIVAALRALGAGAGQ